MLHLVVVIGGYSMLLVQNYVETHLFVLKVSSMHI